MDDYRSTTSLISSGSQHKNLYQTRLALVPSQGGVSRRKKRDDSGSAFTCVIIVGVLLLAVVISMTIIGAWYINHLMEHVGRLEQRVQQLETRPCHSQQEDVKLTEDFKDWVKDDGTEGTGVELRFRRHVDDEKEQESEHHRAEHHGIASHNIALVYGDPARIRTDSVQNGNNHMYYYFSKASWMKNNTKSSHNYNLTHDGRIVVQHEGIYIVHASIHFTGVNDRDAPHYGVYRTDGLGKDPRLISKCVVSQIEKQKSDDEGSGVYPCQTWQLAHLTQGEQVYMSIGGYTWFEIEKETFHLALIKLNNYSL